MYSTNYHIECFKYCFNETQNQVYVTNTIKKYRLPSLAIGISLLTN